MIQEHRKEITNSIIHDQKNETMISRIARGIIA
jgi:hypothetical protein